jgi:hypothetical protein
MQLDGLQCPLLSDFVAKVGGPLQVRNFRIQWARRLNQSCAAGLFFESMLRVGMRKIFLQQYRPIADKMLRCRECPLCADFVAKVFLHR